MAWINASQRGKEYRSPTPVQPSFGVDPKRRKTQGRPGPQTVRPDPGL